MTGTIASASATSSRPITADMFDDLTDVAWSPSWVDGLVVVTFADALPDEVTAQVDARLSSRDDADQAARSSLRAHAAACAALGPDDVAAAAAAALISYVLDGSLEV